MREKPCTARFNNNGLESVRQPTPELEFSPVVPSRRPCASIRFLADSALALVPIERAQRVSRHPADYLRRFGKVRVMPGQRSLREAQLSDGISVRTTRRLGLAQALLHLRQKVMAQSQSRLEEQRFSQLRESLVERPSLQGGHPPEEPCLDAKRLAGQRLGNGLLRLS